MPRKEEVSRHLAIIPVNMKTPILKLAFVFFAIVIAQQVFSQSKDMYEKHWYVSAEGDTLPYRLLIPKNYDSEKEYPLVVFLHGSGSRGTDNDSHLFHPWRMFVADSIRDKYPAFVLLPQCPSNVAWQNRAEADKKVSEFDVPKKDEPSRPLQLMNELVDKLISEKHVDTKRVYIMGLSMGGFGSFEAIERWADKYAAAVPICGGASLVSAASYCGKTAVWIFHGAEDDTVPVELSREIYKMLKEQECDVRYTEYPNVKHTSWHNAFAEPELFQWLFSKQK